MAGDVDAATRDPVLDGPRERLLPYVPRLAIDWLTEAPDQRHRRLDGTMVFIDVSGFTALTERLARRGRAGAEELTSVLDGIFSELLALAWTFGGGLIKFGGDALLLWFSGPLHEQRGCAAAFEMRGRLERVGDLETSAGHVMLQMSVGVHSGAFDYFLVGDSHRELLLTGPQVTMTVAMEAAASPGQVLVSPATASALKPRVLGDAVSGGHLLEARPRGPDNIVHTQVPTGIDLESCVPVGLRRHLLSGERTPEHRMVTIGFLHFLGVDAYLAERGPQVTAEALESVMSVVAQHVNAYGVTLLASDVYEDGGKLILVTGAPEASSNDEERMLRALRGIMDSPLAMAVRAGVNRGHVYAGDVGASMRRTYTVMGDAVNLAARLMQAAEPGQLLTTGVVLERSRTEFSTGALAPLTVKGKAQPVQAFDVHHARGAKLISPGARLPLVGRDREFEELQRCATSARDGLGRCVLLVGEAGLGKTRLIEELRLRADDLAQYSIACEQYERSTPYWPFRLLLRRLLDVPFDASAEEAGTRLEQYARDVDDELLAWLPLLAMPLDAKVASTATVDQIDEQFRGSHVERVTVRLLEHLLARPTMLVIEDSYWLDVASQGLVRSLALAAARRPWLLLLTSRDVDQDVVPSEDYDHIQTIRLTPLESRETEQLAAAASDLAPRPLHELKALAARSGGSPLFLIELIGATRGGEALPESIEAAITAMIDTLDPADRTVLRCAAVLGGSFPLRLAEDTLDTWAPNVSDPLIWNRLDEFVLRETHDRARFRHALIHDVAYEGLPFSHRRKIHAKVGDTIEKDAADPDDQAELLALHFLGAERYDAALRYSWTAGDRARSKAATGDASRFYKQALDAAQRITAPTEDVAQLAETLGDVSELAGLYEDGSHAYRIARMHRRDDPVHVADLLRKEGRIREHAGNYAHARRLYRAGLRLLRRYQHREGVARVSGEVEVLCAAALVHEGRHRPAVWWARRAARTAEQIHAPTILAHAYYLLEWAYSVLGDPVAAEYRELALPIYEELGDLVGQAKVLNNLGAAAYERGEWSAAIGYYERARRAADRAGDLVHAATCTTNVAELLCQQGELEKAEQLFRDSFRVFRGAGFQMGIAWASSYLGLIAGRLGRTDVGRSQLVDARDAFRNMGSESLELEATARLAEVSLLAGDHRSAMAAIVPALDRARSAGGFLIVQAVLQRLQGYALLQNSDVEAADRAFKAALEVAIESEASYEVALTLEAQARLADITGGDDIDAGRRAEEIFRGLGVIRTPTYPMPDAASLRPYLQSGSGPRSTRR